MKTVGDGTLDGTAPQPSLPNWRQYDDQPDLSPVLLTALDLFVEHGYHATTVRNIARKANLSVPGLYHHHPTKQAMLVSLLEYGMEDMTRRIEVALAEADDDPGERLSALVYATVLFMTYRWKIGFLMVSELRGLEPESRDWYQSVNAAQEDLVIETVRVGSDSGDFLTRHPRDAGRAVLRMCQGIAGWFRPETHGPPEVIAYRYVRFALRLARARSEWPPSDGAFPPPP
jgi:AcrR family transcriptional regulator